jgi:GT2 family glycosyltransferase/SAM-dependent methyltransferase
VVGYYGAIADWFDSELVADVAERRADWDFLLVGSTLGADIGRLAKLPNVKLAGEQPYPEIPNWLAKFDVAIIPFKRTPLTEATNPVKAYEILASGRALVSVPLPEISRLGPLVRLASTPLEFEREISAALAEHQPDLSVQRRKFASENTWQKRFEVLAPAVRDKFPKASIIVVTYNNLNLNRLCLEGLYRHTEWPNFEVIVVDNASADGTREYLEEATFQNLRVVLNKTNMGFAAANNIGLAMATGEYLVLLNNDTIVTRRWLTALIGHLRSNPEIGIVGPVTNNIGNEARIDVWYHTLDEIHAFAAEQTTTHDGEIADIDMLAMFCVAFRRDTYENIGPLDEQFGIGLFEDDDYSQRIKMKNLRVVCAADSFVHHFGQASFKKLSSGDYKRLFDDNRRRYEEKWNVRWVPHNHGKVTSGEANWPLNFGAKSGRPQGARERARGLTKNRFVGLSYHLGKCNICGSDTRFFYSDSALYRESLTCGECLSTSRYRSIARGVLLAIKDLTGVAASSLAALAEFSASTRIAVCDTQTPFYFENCAYPIPDVLDRCQWIDVCATIYKPNQMCGARLAHNVTNQNLESLTFPDACFDILITSDVMEHVRLDDRAHQEIRRVLKPGGFYVFTVPHFRDRYQSFHRVLVTDPSNPAKDRFVAPKEYHGDANSEDGAALSYRSYGTCLDDALQKLGFRVDYCKQDFPELGIMNTELFLCRLLT